MLFHNICHIHCLNHPAVLTTVKNLVQYNHIFTGQKICTLSKSVKELEVYHQTKNILNKLGYDTVDVSNHKYREAYHFFHTSLPLLKEKTDSGILFYSHSKGVSYHPDTEDGKATKLWTDVLYHYNLEKYKNIPFSNIKYSTWGTCRVVKKNFLPHKHNELFSYVGTFYWLRLEKLLEKEVIPHSQFTLEALPGIVCSVSESYNQGPTFTAGDSPYLLQSWEKRGINVGFPDKD